MKEVIIPLEGEGRHDVIKVRPVQAGKVPVKAFVDPLGDALKGRLAVVVLVDLGLKDLKAYAGPDNH